VIVILMVLILTAVERGAESHVVRGVFWTHIIAEGRDSE
jgi:hypothetical protein